MKIFVVFVIEGGRKFIGQYINEGNYKKMDIGNRLKVGVLRVVIAYVLLLDNEKIYLFLILVIKMVFRSGGIFIFKMGKGLSVSQDVG